MSNWLANDGSKNTKKFGRGSRSREMAGTNRLFGGGLGLGTTGIDIAVDEDENPFDSSSRTKSASSRSKSNMSSTRKGLSLHNSNSMATNNTAFDAVTPKSAIAKRPRAEGKEKDAKKKKESRQEGREGRAERLEVDGVYDKTGSNSASDVSSPIRNNSSAPSLLSFGNRGKVKRGGDLKRLVSDTSPANIAWLLDKITAHCQGKENATLSTTFMFTVTLPEYSTEHEKELLAQWLIQIGFSDHLIPTTSNAVSSMSGDDEMIVYRLPEKCVDEMRRTLVLVTASQSSHTNLNRPDRIGTIDKELLDTYEGDIDHEHIDSKVRSISEAIPNTNTAKDMDATSVTMRDRTQSSSAVGSARTGLSIFTSQEQYTAAQQSAMPPPSSTRASGRLKLLHPFPPREGALSVNTDRSDSPAGGVSPFTISPRGGAFFGDGSTDSGRSTPLGYNLDNDEVYPTLGAGLQDLALQTQSRQRSFSASNTSTHINSSNTNSNVTAARGSSSRTRVYSSDSTYLETVHEGSYNNENDGLHFNGSGSDVLLGGSTSGNNLSREIAEGDEEGDLVESLKPEGDANPTYDGNDGNTEESDTSTVLDAEEEGDVFDPDESSQHLDIADVADLAILQNTYPTNPDMAAPLSPSRYPSKDNATNGASGGLRVGSPIRTRRSVFDRSHSIDETEEYVGPTDDTIGQGGSGSSGSGIEYTSSNVFAATRLKRSVTMPALGNRRGAGGDGHNASTPLAPTNKNKSNSADPSRYNTPQGTVSGILTSGRDSNADWGVSIATSDVIIRRIWRRLVSRLNAPKNGVVRSHSVDDIEIGGISTPQLVRLASADHYPSDNHNHQNSHARSSNGSTVVALMQNKESPGLPPTLQHHNSNNTHNYHHDHRDSQGSNNSYIPSYPASFSLLQSSPVDDHQSSSKCQGKNKSGHRQKGMERPFSPIAGTSHKESLPSTFLLDASPSSFSSNNHINLGSTFPPTGPAGPLGGSSRPSFPPSMGIHFEAHDPLPSRGGVEESGFDTMDVPLSHSLPLAGDGGSDAGNGSAFRRSGAALNSMVDKARATLHRSQSTEHSNQGDKDGALFTHGNQQSSFQSIRAPDFQPLDANNDQINTEGGIDYIPDMEEPCMVDGQTSYTMVIHADRRKKRRARNAEAKWRRQSILPTAFLPLDNDENGDSNDDSGDYHDTQMNGNYNRLKIPPGIRGTKAQGFSNRHAEDIVMSTVASTNNQAKLSIGSSGRGSAGSNMALAVVCKSSSKKLRRSARTRAQRKAEEERQSLLVSTHGNHPSHSHSANDNNSDIQVENQGYTGHSSNLKLGTLFIEENEMNLDGDDNDGHFENHTNYNRKSSHSTMNSHSGDQNNDSNMSNDLPRNISPFDFNTAIHHLAYEGNDFQGEEEDEGYGPGCELREGDTHRHPEVLDLDERSFSGIIIGGVYQQCFDGFSPLVAPPGPGVKRITGLRLMPNDNLVLFIYFPSLKTHKYYDLGQTWHYMRAAPVGYLVFKNPIVLYDSDRLSNESHRDRNSNQRRFSSGSAHQYMKPGSLFFYIPHHPLEWAADLESEHRYTDQLHTHSVSDGYGGMLTLYPENDHHGPPSTNQSSDSHSSSFFNIHDNPAPHPSHSQSIQQQNNVHLMLESSMNRSDMIEQTDVVYERSNDDDDDNNNNAHQYSGFSKTDAGNIDMEVATVTQSQAHMGSLSGVRWADNVGTAHPPTSAFPHPRSTPAGNENDKDSSRGSSGFKINGRGRPGSGNGHSFSTGSLFMHSNDNSPEHENILYSYTESNIAGTPAYQTDNSNGNIGGNDEMGDVTNLVHSHHEMSVDHDHRNESTTPHYHSSKYTYDHTDALINGHDEDGRASLDELLIRTQVDWNQPSIVSYVLEFLLDINQDDDDEEEAQSDHYHRRTNMSHRGRRGGSYTIRSKGSGADCIADVFAFRLVSKAWALGTYRLLARYLSILRHSSYFNWSNWAKFVSRYPWGRYLNDGATKHVYCVQNKDTGTLEAVSIMNIIELQKRSMEAAITKELEICLAASSLFTLNICPFFVRVHSTFRSECPIPDSIWHETTPAPIPKYSTISPRERSDSIDLHNTTTIGCNNDGFGLSSRHGRKLARSQSLTFRSQMDSVTPADVSQQRSNVVIDYPALSIPKKQTLTLGKYQYIRQEYCSGGDLEMHVREQRTLLVTDIRLIAFQMCFALYCGREQLALRHFDIKLLNFLITKGGTLLPPQFTVAEHKRVNSPFESLLNLHAKTDNVVDVKIGFGHNIFVLPMSITGKGLVKLTDFGTSCIGQGGLGEEISIQQFTTLENVPPEYLLQGTRCRQSYSADTWQLGLSFLHLVTGYEPYEVLLADVYCPKYLIDKLSQIWSKRQPPYAASAYDDNNNNDGDESDEYDDDYDVIRQVLSMTVMDDYEEQYSYGYEGALLCHTLYRYFVLFWNHYQQETPSDDGHIHDTPLDYLGHDNVIVSTIRTALGLDEHSMHHNNSFRTKRRNQKKNPNLSHSNDLQQCREAFRKDSAQWNIFVGDHAIIKNMRLSLRRMNGNGHNCGHSARHGDNQSDQGVPNGLDLLAQMVSFDPAKRCSMYEALNHPVFHSLIDRDPEAEEKALACRAVGLPTHDVPSTTGSMSPSSQLPQRKKDSHHRNASTPSPSMYSVSYMHYYESIIDGGNDVIQNL